MDEEGHKSLKESHKKNFDFFGKKTKKIKSCSNNKINKYIYKILLFLLED